jgi:hypothetical protein
MFAYINNYILIHYSSNQKTNKVVKSYFSMIEIEAFV